MFLRIFAFSTFNQWIKMSPPPTTGRANTDGEAIRGKVVGERGTEAGKERKAVPAGATHRRGRTQTSTRRSPGLKTHPFLSLCFPHNFFPTPKCVSRADVNDSVLPHTHQSFLFLNFSRTGSLGQVEMMASTAAPQRSRTRVSLLLWPLLVACCRVTLAQELPAHGVNGYSLHPPYFNLAEGTKITATATCGVDETGRTLQDLYCKLVGGPVSGDPSQTIQVRK